MVGQTLSHYKVTEKLGEGGMGVVYLAEDTRLGRKVALKFLPREATAREEDLRRFEQEARAAAKLNHPNICTLYSFDEHEGRPFLVMEYLEGKTLRDLMSEGSLPVEEALSYARQIAEAISEAHDAGIIHRDIKPSNVMIGEEDRVKVMDFGIAKLKGGERITRTGDTIGTAAYMAPEQIQGREIDRRADLFSLGVVFYEMLTGRHPFPAEYRQAIAYQIINEDADPPSTYREELTERIDEVVLRCLEKKPEERYDSAEELLSDLQEAMPKEAASSASGAGGSASEAEGLLSVQGWLRRRRVVGLGALAAVALLMGWWLLSGSASEEAREAMTGRSEPEITERSVAVLPFTNLSADEEVTSVSRGLHDDLLTRLSNIGDLQVTSRTSVERYRGTELPLPAIAESLGVRWIVEGGVQEAGGLVQVNAQLIDPETDAHVWADRYQRELTAEDLFAIQEEIAEEIARALEAELTAGEQERIAGAPTEDLEAYRLYVQGRAHLDRRTEEGMERAIELFEEAIARDSSYALAWSGLADARNLLSFYGLGSRAMRKQALDAARRARELNPDLAEAHASVGLSHEQLRRDGPAALQAWRRAAELQPSYAEARHWLGWLLLGLGRPDRGLDHLRTAAELDPRSPAIHTSVSQGLWLTEESTERALEHLRRSIQLEPQYTLARVVKGVLLLDSGRDREARETLQRALDGATEESFVWELCFGGLGTAYARLDSTEKTRALLRRLDSREQAPLAKAMIHVALGERTLALQALEQVDVGVMQFVYLRYLPMLDPLRSDPRYDELIREANRTWNLNPDGSIPKSEDLSAGL